MEKDKVIALITPEDVTLSHPFFEYISHEEKTIISREIWTKKSHIVAFRKNEKIKFAAIISIDRESVHLREVGGAFAFNMYWVHKYCVILAKRFNLSKLTFKSDIETVVKIAEKFGFKNNFENQYIKELA